MPIPLDEKLARLEALRQEVRETGEISEGDLVELIRRLQAEASANVEDEDGRPAASVAGESADEDDEAIEHPEWIRRPPEPDMAAVEQVFREILPARVPGYELREPQVQLAREIARALAEAKHLVSEAGTGTGKSLAYLIPAILWARATGRAVVVSTGTIALQEQLLGKDIPFLRQHLAVPFTAVLAKGKGNYLCLVRLQEAAKDPDVTAHPDWSRLHAWAQTTATGDRSELTWVPESRLWDAVNVDDTCQRRQCPAYEECLYYAARKRLRAADIIVCNHALLLTDMGIRARSGGGASVLPPFSALVLDEAHHLEDQATEAFGTEFSQFRVPALVRQVGKLKHPDLPLQVMDRARDANMSLFGWFATYEVQGPDGRPRQFDKAALRQIPDETPAKLATELGEALEELAGALDSLEWHWADDRERQKAEKYAERARNYRQDLADIFDNANSSRWVSWVEVERREDKPPRVTLHRNPVDVGPELRTYLWGPLQTVICTSATISAGGTFEYFKSRTGLAEAPRGVLELQVDSPFDYANQALLYIPRGLPDPQDAKWPDAIVAQIRDILLAAGGRAFVLHTSYAQMQRTYEALASELEAAGYTVFRQGDAPRGQLVEIFKAVHAEGGRPVLFATGTFWEGISVEGEALSCVIIDKLPFSVPTDPISEAKVEAIKRAGGDPFMDYTVPQAIIRLKQGFGRLIRTRSDRGLVAILDNRLRTKPYGRLFLRSLPPAREIYHLGPVRELLGGGV